MRSYSMIIGIGLLWASQAIQAEPGQSGQYTVTPIDFPGSAGTTMVTGTNDGGAVIGGFTSSSQHTRGFIRLLGIYSWLPSPACKTAVCDTTPLAINSLGDIAGEFSDDVQHRAVFVIRGGLLLQLIGIPSSSNVALLGGLNDRGDVVGFFQTDSGVIRMFEYSGLKLSVPAVPADFVDVAAKGINNSGQITGSYDNATGLHGFLDTRGTFTRLDVPGGLDTSPVAMNNSGDLAGNYSVLSSAGVSVQRGFLFTRGQYTNVDFPGGANTLPSALNNAGTVAGTYEDPAVPAPFNTNAFVFQRGKYVRLPLPGAAQSVGAINSHGEVVGTYFDPGCPFSCTVHGFRATPAH